MANETSGGITDADIDALLNQMNSPAGEAAAESAATESAPAERAAAPLAADSPSTVTGSDADDQAAIDALLQSATFEDATVGNAVENAAAAAAQIDLPSMGRAGGHGALPLDLPDLQRALADAQASSIDLLRDVDLNVKIELGRSRMLVEDVLKLAEGSVVELDKLAGDPVDVYVNDRLVARGEVLVLNDSFCVRVNEIVAGAAELG